MINIKRKSLTQIFIIILLCYICYLFGLFTHFLEKDINEFHYPSHIDIRLAIQRLQINNNDKIKYIDINHNNYTFVYDAAVTCTIGNDQSKTPFVIVLVKSKLTNFEQRKVIRDTWGVEAHKLESTNPMRIVFLVGISETESLDDDQDTHHQHHNSKIVYKRDLKTVDIDQRLRTESDQYGDIVQQNFYDTYFNNTLKAIMGLKWIDTYCPQSTYYLFIDDDYFLNPNLLVEFLNKNLTIDSNEYNNLYAGFVFENSSPMRHFLSKWYISLDEYPYDKFPPYVSAGCYLLSRKSARLFHIASKLITLFRFDDIYMGILAYKLNIKPLNVESIHFYEPYFEPEYFARQVIASHGFSPPEKLLKIWKEMTF